MYFSISQWYPSTLTAFNCNNQSITNSDWLIVEMQIDYLVVCWGSHFSLKIRNLSLKIKNLSQMETFRQLLLEPGCQPLSGSGCSSSWSYKSRLLLLLLLLSIIVFMIIVSSRLLLLLPIMIMKKDKCYIKRHTTSWTSSSSWSGIT